MELLCMHKLCTATANNTSTTAKMDLILLDQYRITNVLLQGWLKQNKTKRSQLLQINHNYQSGREKKSPYYCAFEYGTDQSRGLIKMQFAGNGKHIINLIYHPARWVIIVFYDNVLIIRQYAPFHHLFNTLREIHIS